MEAAELETVSQSEEVLPAVKHVGATGTELLFFAGLATSELVKCNSCSRQLLFISAQPWTWQRSESASRSSRAVQDSFAALPTDMIMLVYIVNISGMRDQSVKIVKR